jgi:hypothetical protein
MIAQSANGDARKGERKNMKKSSFCSVIGLFLLFALLGCAGILQEGAVKTQEPSAQPATVAPSLPPVPDESETIRAEAKEMLLGKWKRQALGDDTIEFLGDDTVIFYKDQIEITMKKGGTLTWGYAVTKGDLTLTTPTGVDMKYKRYRGK